MRLLGLPSLTRLGLGNAQPGSPASIGGGKWDTLPCFLPLGLGSQTRWLLFHHLLEFFFACFLCCLQDLQLYLAGRSREKWVYVMDKFLKIISHGKIFKNNFKPKFLVNVSKLLIFCDAI